MKRKNSGFTFKHIAIFGVVVCLLALFGYVGIAAMKKDDPEVAEINIATGLATVKLSKKDLQHEIITVGVVTSQTTEYVVSTNPSKILKILVKQNDMVRKGANLCTLDTSTIDEAISELSTSKNGALKDFQPEIDKAQEVVTKAQNEYNDKKKSLDEEVETRKVTLEKALAKAKETAQTSANKHALPELNLLNSAKTAYDKDPSNAQKKQIYETALDKYNAAVKEWYDPQMASFKNSPEQGAYDNAVKARTNALTQLQGIVDQAKAQLAAITNNPATSGIDSQLETLRTQKSDFNIKAPVAGTVTKVLAKEGTSAVGHLFTIEDLAHFDVVAILSETDKTGLTVDMPAKIKGNIGDESVEWNGKIKKIAEEADDNGNFQVVFSLEGDTSKLKSGSSMTISLQGEKRNGVFAVPYLSVVRNDYGEDTISVLIKQRISDDEGNYSDKYLPEEIVVETGIETASEIEVTGKELEDGLEILVDPQLFEASNK